MNTQVVMSITSMMIPLLYGWFWYDKRVRDRRLDQLENQIKDQQAKYNKLTTDVSVINAEAKHARELVQVQLAQVNVALNEIKILLKENKYG